MSEFVVLPITPEDIAEAKARAQKHFDRLEEAWQAWQSGKASKREVMESFVRKEDADRIEKKSDEELLGSSCNALHYYTDIDASVYDGVLSDMVWLEIASRGESLMQKAKDIEEAHRRGECDACKFFQEFQKQQDNKEMDADSKDTLQPR